MISAARLAQKLVSGIYGRLEFDFACNRGHGFSEAHLHGVMMEILAANISAQSNDVQPSFAASAIQDRNVDRGRKREVDFAVLDRQDFKEIICIEAKWAGSSHASAENILIDLARLAAINSESPDTVCLFVFAGGKSAMLRRLSSGAFSPHGSKRKPRKLLRYPYDAKPNNYPLRDGVGEYSVLSEKLRAKVSENLPTVPPRVRTHLYKPSHLSPPDWSVQVWRVWG